MVSRDSKTLRFTPFEHFMFEGGDRSHPMCFYLRLNLEWVFTIEQLRQAIECIGPRHPFFGATVQKKHGQYYWELERSLPRVEQHGYGRYLNSSENWSVDLARESGLRLSFSQPGPECEIWMQVHHSCSDARGALDYVRDLLLTLQQLRNAGSVGQYSPLRREDFAASRRARASGENRGSRLQFLWPFSAGWRRVCGYYAHRSRALLLSSKNKQTQFSPSYVRRRVPFSIAQWRDRKAVGTERNTIDGEDWLEATLNDCLVASVFRSLAWMFKRVNGTSTHAWLRIAVPIDQRTSSEDSPMASNRSSVVFLDRHTNAIDRAHNLLEGVTREMDEIKRKNLGDVLNDVLSALRWLPWGIKIAARDSRCAVTAVVSNLGAVDEELQKICSRSTQASRPGGSLSVNELDFLVPLRKGTQIGLGAATHRGGLQLALHYDARWIDGQAAQELLNRICVELARLGIGDQST